MVAAYLAARHATAGCSPVDRYRTAVGHILGIRCMAVELSEDVARLAMLANIGFAVAIVLSNARFHRLPR